MRAERTARKHDQDHEQEEEDEHKHIPKREGKRQ
jgi:hypothetical protein